jgi:hypothetical protein
MPSKGVVDRQRVARRLIAAARTHAHEVGVRLPSHLAEPSGDGGTPSLTHAPELARFQDELARLLERRLDDLIEADAAHLRAQRSASVARARRAEATGGVYRKITDLRAVVRGAYGRDGVRELLWLDGPTPREPLVLQRWTDRLLRVLGELPVELPPPRWKGVELDLSGAAAELRGLADALERAVDDVDDRCRVIESRKREKYRALEVFDETVRGVAPALRGLYRLAGRPELADRVRATLPNTRAATSASRKES